MELHRVNEEYSNDNNNNSANLSEDDGYQIVSIWLEFFIAHQDVSSTQKW